MHPVLFSIPKFSFFGKMTGPLDIYSFGVILALSFMIALIIAVKRKNVAGVSSEEVMDIGLIIMFSGIIGARLGWVLINIKSIENFWQIFDFRNGGLSLHGSLIGGLIALWIYSNIKKKNIGKILDMVTPSVIIGIAIGRIGCFMNGCCYGVESSIFSASSVFHGHHPAQLYEMFLDFILFIFVLFYEKRTKFSGELFITFIMGYSVVRFIVEIFRFDRFHIGILNLGQFVSVILIVISAFLIISLRKKRDEHKG